MALSDHGRAQKRHEFITVEHLLLAMLDNPTAAEVLASPRGEHGRVAVQSPSDFISQHTPVVSAAKKSIPSRRSVSSA